MHKKIVLKYVTISFVLMSASFIIGFAFSWLFDDENVGKKVIFFFPLAILWFGCLYFAILVQRLFRTKNILKNKFIGLTDLMDENVLKMLGASYKKKFPFILIFPLFIFFIFIFCAFKRNYQKRQLSKFGVQKILTVDSVSFNKSGRNIHTTLNYNNKKFTYIFTVNDSLKKNDCITLIFLQKTQISIL
ncbi:hypothetical protein ASG01_11520 [Chryseobacterium sp. Leaf180]|uniref:hypothetical protein n=1 Tax=Chryseobacterium sp. Leaf180 TaxID=1736289 RepID=UPI0007151C40|nr:hypothetical protein [Chryseobacterium sp. Leaf180]KQR92536.1 hypothetical protein ASG01_11520 [Chryseobacterium sp. Leaf180]